MALSSTPFEHDVSYAPARGPVLLLSCMDPRLLDEIVLFMTHDNLTNRYDHVILAGAALGALGGTNRSMPTGDRRSSTISARLASCTK